MTIKLKKYFRKDAYCIAFVSFILFPVIILIFEGVIFQIMTFSSGLLTLLLTLRFQQNQANNKVTVMCQNIKENVQQFFPYIDVNEVREVKHQKGDSSLILQIQARDIVKDHVQVKVIRRYIESQFNLKEVIVEFK